MDAEILQVQIIETFAAKILIPLLVAAIPGGLISIAILFGLKKMRMAEALDIEKKKIELEIKAEFVKKALKLIENLEAIIRVSYEEFLSADLANDFSNFKGSYMINKQLNAIGNFFSHYEDKISTDFKGKLMNLENFVEKLITDKL